MADSPRDRRSTDRVEFDADNRNPFRGVPHDFPSGHSCFPIKPSKGFGDLSFGPSFDQNVRPEESLTMTEDEKKAWRASMLQFFDKSDE